MDDMPIAGTIFVIIGVLMMVFHRAIGTGFCRVGKHVWKNRENPLGMSQDMIERMYDEKRAPRIMLFLGVVMVVQGVFFCFFPIIMNVK